jgi:hypothetical protein
MKRVERAGSGKKTISCTIPARPAPAHPSGRVWGTFFKRIWGRSPNRRPPVLRRCSMTGGHHSRQIVAALQSDVLLFSVST